MTYSEWIVINVIDPVSTCREVTMEMEKEFPELTRVRGHYHCWIWGVREHWWLFDPAGNVVDPTRAQFPSRGDGVYVPWNEGAPEPTGKCANCGDYVFDGSTLCGESCRVEFMVELGG